MNSNTWSIYIHTNKINGKSYVGITSKKPRERWGKNGNGYTPNQIISRAIKKYGWDNFEHKIIETGLSQEEASDKERYYIALYDTLLPNGYNSAEGGYNSNISEFQRENMSKIKSIPIICVETQEIFPSAVNAAKKYGVNSSSILRAIKKGYSKSCGYHWMKLSDFQTKGYAEKLYPKKRHVICLETGVIYNCANEADLIYGMAGGSVARCCNKKTSTCAGKHWAYYDEFVQNEGKVTCKQKKSKGFRVLCIETGEIFPSMKQAGEKYGVTSGTIKPACEKTTRTAGGLHWKYLD